MAGMSVIVFGAGIAGLTAAHYLVQRGYDVTVVEALAVPGGLARSERKPQQSNIPSEYSWRGFGPWYTNCFEVMKEIPIDAVSSVYDKELARPISFELLPDELSHTYLSNEFRLSSLDTLSALWMAARVAVADERSSHEYAKLNAAEYLHKTIGAKGAHTIASILGPWVGSDKAHCSLHHAGKFFQRNIFPGRLWEHGDKKGTWTQSSGDGWLVMRGPINEAWFDPWVKHLQNKGVKFLFSTALQRLYATGSKITSALTSAGVLAADNYISAINPFSMEQVILASGLRGPQLDKFGPLTSQGEHVQISFRIAFAEPIKLPAPRTAIVLVDSEFDITFYAQDQLWAEGTNLGDGIAALWSGTATVSNVPGRLYGKPMIALTKEEFLEEIKYQMGRSQTLQQVIKENNSGRTFSSYTVKHWEVWHAWQFPPQVISVHSPEPKWVNSTSVPPGLQPSVRTEYTNLWLAGAHVTTSADLYSMEAAVESGREAADSISGQTTVQRQKVPAWLKGLQAIDNAFYRVGLPNVLDFTLLCLAILMAYWLLKRWR